MFDLVKLMLRLIYYQSRLLGVLNIEIDLGTGRARSARLALLPAMIILLVGLAYMVQLFYNEIWLFNIQKSTELHHYFTTILLIVRLIYTYSTILTQFRNSHDLVRLINGYRRLARKRPQIVRLWRRGILCKSLSLAVNQLIQTLIIVFLVWGVKYPLGFCILICYLPPTLTDLVTFQFYFALLNAHAHYLLLNWELRQVLDGMMTLEPLSNRPAMLMIRCCSLADRLEAIAEEQSHLQSLIDGLTNLFGLQLLCISIHYYVYMITIMFYAYSVLKQNEPREWINIKVALSLSKVICHMLDMLISSNMAYFLLDQHAEMVDLLAGIAALGMQLDVRLESVYESFVLQLACNPLRLPVLGIFRIDRSQSIILLNSLIRLSLVIIEFDIKTS